MKRLLIVAMCFTGIGACSSTPVAPWEREILAKREMLFDAHPVDAAFDDHVYFSKEGSSGGRGFGGGGCGCN